MKTLLNSYQTYFRDIWPILRDMSKRGIPIDESRRMELKALIEREDLRVTEEIKKIVPEEVLSTKQKNGLKREPKDTTGLVQIEVTISKEEKCSCLKKSRATCPVCLGTGIVPVGTVLKRWAMPTEFNPNSKQQVIRFMKFMKHPVPKSAKKIDSEGNASDTTEVKELERLFTKTKHPIYPLLIQKRQLTKVDGTYCEGWKPAKDGRIRSTFTFNTATWQTSSKEPNVQNGLKHGKTPFQKELAKKFVAMQKAEKGHVMINFDFSAFHALTTAHDFNMPAYARLAKIDIHSFVACQFLKLPECKGLYERDDADMKALFKSLRKNPDFDDVRAVRAKQTILGIQFGRGPTSIYTMYKEFFEGVWEAKAIWSLVYDLFPRMRIAQNEVKKEAAETNRLINKYGAIRHFFDVEHWDRKSQKMVPGDQAEAAIAFLPASHAFGHVRDVFLRIRANGWDDKYGLVNSIHDSLVFHCPIDLKDECMTNIKAEMEKPSSILVYPEMAPEGLIVGADAAFGESMAECK